MVRTPAQKRAVAAFNRKLQKARKHIASGGSKYSWTKKTNSNTPISKSRNKTNHSRPKRNNNTQVKKAKLTPKPKLASPTEFGLKKFRQLNRGRKIPDRSSFTVASPVGRKNGNLTIQDIHFYFEKKRLVRMKKLKNIIPFDEKKFQKKSGVSPLSNITRPMGPRRIK